MAEIKNPYQQVIKATSLFGGVQVFNIFVSIIRSKFIALFLGSLGMGISGLLNSTLNIINEITKLGLDTSAVKEIAYSCSSESHNKAEILISTLKRIVWFTGLIGVLFTLMFSSYLSQLAFGNTDYAIAFIWISIALLFRQLTTAQLAVLQGMRKLKLLAKANLYGSFFGLVVILPIYYVFRIEGIVPAIILMSFISYAFSTYFSKKVKIEKVKITNKEALVEGKQMLKLGIMLCLRSVITILSAYLIQIFISNYGGVAEVGFYTAGFVIINSYVGLIFNAMQTDYFPRLSAISDNLVKIRETVVQQAFIAILLITPIIVVFLTFAPLVITLLYSKEFLSITGLVCWGILGTIFKAVSWSMGYVILAKGDSRLFIKTAIFFNLLFVILLTCGYIVKGLEGVGIAFLIYCFMHYLGLTIITYKKYNLYFDSVFNRVFALCIVICGVTFIASYFESLFLKYGVMGFMDVLSITFALYHINKKINIIEVVKKFYRNKKC